MIRARIAIAEPDSDIATLLAHVVERLGHRAADASAERIAPGDIDALVLEPASAPAVALAHELRRRRPELPIVCFSRLEQGREGQQLDPVRYLVKPAPLHDLAEALAAALADRQ